MSTLTGSSSSSPTKVQRSATASTLEQPVSTTVYGLLHELHARIVADVDAVLTWDELKSPAFQFSVVKPILDRYTADETAIAQACKDDDDNDDNVDASKSLGAVLYALMANRCVLRKAQADAAESSSSASRTRICPTSRCRTRAPPSASCLRVSFPLSNPCHPLEVCLPLSAEPIVQVQSWCTSSAVARKSDRPDSHDYPVSLPDAPTSSLC